jgi:glycerophosphoryl diester phosphodiesterase
MPAAPLIISHAACGGLAPENTLAGIRAALGLGVDAIEIDVRASADGVPVLMHDATVDRTTNGSGAVSAMTIEELQRLEAGGSTFEGRFAGEHVPSLAQVLDLIRERCTLVVEIKQIGIASPVIDVLRGAAALSQAMVWSFDLETVTEVRQIEPLLPSILLLDAHITDPARSFDDVLRRGLSGLSVHRVRMDADVSRGAHLRGLVAYAWTVDEVENQLRLRDCGVDGIVTNRPDLLIEALRR